MADRGAAGAPSTSGSHANGAPIDLDNVDDILARVGCGMLWVARHTRPYNRPLQGLQICRSG